MGLWKGIFTSASQPLSFGSIPSVEIWKILHRVERGCPWNVMCNWWIPYIASSKIRSWELICLPACLLAEAIIDININIMVWDNTELLLSLSHSMILLSFCFFWDVDLVQMILRQTSLSDSHCDELKSASCDLYQMMRKIVGGTGVQNEVGSELRSCNEEKNMPEMKRGPFFSQRKKKWRGELWRFSKMFISWGEFTI